MGTSVQNAPPLDALFFIHRVVQKHHLRRSQPRRGTPEPVRAGQLEDEVHVALRLVLQLDRRDDDVLANVVRYRDPEPAAHASHDFVALFANHD
eukprot:30228-Pelagococcus_subviridis.AAC.1